jgi:hypothetical protein
MGINDPQENQCCQYGLEHPGCYEQAPITIGVTFSEKQTRRHEK